MTMKPFLAGLAIVVGVLSSPSAQQVVLVEDGTSTRYISNATDPGFGLGWTAELFDDSGWSEGPFGIGYDESFGLVRNEALTVTEVPVGAWSIYTRVKFTIDDLALVQSLHLGADWDDGWIAWINGTQIHCSAEMTTCSPDWKRGVFPHESSNSAYPNYGTLLDVTAATSGVLHTGENVLAIGVWNATGGDDLVISPLLVLNLPAVRVTRGPYLQQTRPTATTVRWRTDTATDSRVSYRTYPGGPIQTSDDATVSTEHEVSLSGLTPGTTYAYAVGTTAEVLVGFDDRHRFTTPPATGSRQPLQFWVLGDSGAASANAGVVRQAYETLTGGEVTDAWLMLGDNAYESGTEEEYQRGVFDAYPRQLRSISVWPTFGNHDSLSSSSVTTSGPYYDAFSLPSAAEAGGAVSGTEAYYSFDIGNVHFISLNSEDIDREPTGDMLLWLEQDLSQTVADWIVAFWHHPPYSKGTHDSDVPGNSGGRLTDMRENALPILEDWGVDLVLTGHSHVYERSVLVDGHYGTSDTLTPTMTIDTGDGRLDGDGAYEKASPQQAPHEGAVYVVAGNGSRIGGGTLDHPVMSVSLNLLGSLVINVEGDRLQLRFLDRSDNIRDHFTLVKNTTTSPVANFAGDPLTGAAPLTVNFEDLSSTNTASWNWDFDGDALSDSIAIEPLHIYSDPGEYAVRLDASNSAGSSFESKPGYVCVSNGNPDVITGLTFLADKQTMQWAGFQGSATFDTIKGDLVALRNSSGEFSGSVLACLENDDTDETASDLESPEKPGDSFFYLARRASCASTVGTYDSEGSRQSASRDAGIGGATQSCP
jgi:PKD repeat protein